MAGGFKPFGPTYNATKYVRVLHEGMVNGNHDIASTEEELAGKIAAMTATGVALANKGQGAVGLFVEDLGDMQNASGKASFYFRGGEYYVAAARTGFTDGAEYDADDKETWGFQINGLVPGDELTTDEQGRLIKRVVVENVENGKAVGVVTKVGAFPMGNMYEHAGLVANGDTFIGFILYV